MTYQAKGIFAIICAILPQKFDIAAYLFFYDMACFLFLDGTKKDSLVKEH